MRDPHLFYSNGQAYVLFETSTGLDDGYQGTNNLYNKAYFGGTDASMATDQAQLLATKDKTQQYDKAYFANAALGLLKLNDDFTVASIEKPLLSANGVTDEMERPNIFEHDGKWYMFTVARGWHMASDNSTIINGDNGSIVYLLGFVSEDGMQGHYKPINGNGLILASDLYAHGNALPYNTSFTYSYLVLPNNESNTFVVTSYLDSRTFAASYLMEIDGDKAKVLNDRVLDQGALVDNGISYKAYPQNDKDPFKLTPQNNQTLNGYLYDGSPKNGGYRWYQDNQLYTGFQYYMGAYYWFDQGVRQDNSFHEAWGKTYYTGNDGRAVQGIQNIHGQELDFGNDGTYYLRSTGYLWDGSAENGGYRWYENGELFSGFRYYAGTYYWFVDGVRQNAGWRQAWGYTYYTDQDGRAVQGTRVIDGKVYNFGDDGTYYSRPVQGYVWDGSPANGGYRWYENGELFTGFRYYTGTYYWFIDGVRQNAGWREAWGYKYYTDGDGRAVQGWQKIDGVDYYFGDDNTFYLR